MRCEIQNIDEIEAMASSLAEEINRFLKERGFSIKVDEIVEGAFGIVGILDLMVEWLSVGGVEDIKYLDTLYSAVNLSTNVSYFSLPNGEIVVEVETKSNDSVYMVMFKEPEDGLTAEDASCFFMDILNDTDKILSPKYEGVIFPMVDLNIQPDVSWIHGLTNGEWFISEAKMQCKLRMNQFGARAQAAFVASMARCLVVEKPKPRFIIDRPFLMWISRPGVSRPLFTAYVDCDSWKDPGDLSVV